MKIKGIDAYRESEVLEGTLAMSNLAKSFTNAGFKQEAEEMISKALAIPGYDKNIGSAISNLREKLEEETNKENDILEQTKPIRQFLSSFANMSLEPTLTSLGQSYQGSEYTLAINIDKDQLTANANFEQKTNKLPVSYAKATESQVRINIQGKVTGLTCTFHKTVYEDEVEKSSSEGMLVFSKELDRITVLSGEIDEKSETEIFTLSH